MKRIITLMVAATAGLTACGGSDHKMTNAEVLSSWKKAELYYSFPYDGQQNLSLNTPLVLRFSEPVDAEKFTEKSVVLKCDSGICNDKGAATIAWSEDKQFEFVDNNLGVVLTPGEKLDANSKYCAELADVPTASGGKVLTREVCFKTSIAPTHRGSLVELGVSDSLSIEKMHPNLVQVDESPIMDFSTYRFQFNEPLDSNAVRYGEHVKLLDAKGALVEDVTLLVSRNTMTVHPAALLTPGQQYKLVFNNLPALHGKTEGQPKTFSEAFAFTPKSSEPRTILVQDTVRPSEFDTNPCSDASYPKKSILTGQALNCVPLDSVILGDKDASMQKGDLLAELAYIPNYPNITPLRVPRGSLLSGSSIKVRVAGNVPAAADDSMDTGEISVTVLSDAIGYIYPNPYSSAPDAPKQIKLYMDAAMTAENSVPNVVLSQDVMHIELNGMASLDGKSMQVDALGVVEPDILGAEMAFGFLSFQMKSYAPSEQQKVFDEVAKKVVEAPQLSSIYPHIDIDAGMSSDEGETISFLPSDALTINFDKPLDVRTLRYGDTFSLEENGVEMDAAAIEWYLDGASLAIKNKNGYQSQNTYTVKLSDEVTGLPSPVVVEEQAEGAGSVRRYFANEGEGKAIAPLTYSFTVHHFDDSNLEYAGDLSPTYAPKLFKNPLLFATYPGYPCAAEWDESGTGNCIGDTGQNGKEKMTFKPQLVQSNRPIHLTFSKAIAPIAAGAFEVKDEDGNPVAGEIEQSDFDLFFTPKEPWEVGKKYYYVVNTDPKDCSKGFCGKNGQPLMTAPLAIEDGDEKNAFTVGEMYFIGTENTNTVYQSLRNTPTLDTPAVMTYFRTKDDEANKNKIFEQTQALIEAGDGVPNSARLELNGASGLVHSGHLGCKGGKGEYCPEKAYLHLAGNLNAEILGAAQYTCLYEDKYKEEFCGEEGADALLVGIYPTVVATGSADLFANLLFPEIPADTPLLLETATGVQIMRIKPSDQADAFKFYGENVLAEHKLVKGNPNGLIQGWIRESEDGPLFETRVQVYLDAPYLSLKLSEIIGDALGDALGENGPLGFILGLPGIKDAVGAITGGLDYLLGLIGKGTQLDGLLQHNMRNYPLDLSLQGPVEFLPSGRMQIHQKNIHNADIKVKIDMFGEKEANIGQINLTLPANGAYIIYEGKPIKK